MPEKPATASTRNPLTKYFAVEERPDGVYLSVTRENRGSIKPQDLYIELERALVINFDRELIASVLESARGAPEKIGPPFMYYNPKLDNFVLVTIQPLRATVKISSLCLTEGLSPTCDDLIYCLKRKGVRYGIKEDTVQTIITSAQYDVDIAIAEGKAPGIGNDASINFDIDVNPNSKPQMRKNGSVDYRDIHTVAMVGQGQVIATKIPATPGEPGISVTGEKIEGTPGKDVDLPGGKNTSASVDGKHLIATKAGIIIKDGISYNVSELLQINKDVDFSVGNIKYTGDIAIGGNILSGFTVEADGNILVKGEVEGAQIISRNGTITIAGGVIGKNETLISAKQGITVSHVQEATLKTEGAITIERFCMHCDCLCENFAATDPKSSVLGGHIQAFHSVVVNQIGNDKGVATRVTIIDKKALVCKEKIVELAALEAKLKTEIEPIEKQIRTKTAILKKSGTQITDRHRDEIKKWIDAFSAIAAKIKYVQKKAAETTEEMKNVKNLNGFIHILHDMYPGTILSMYGRSKSIETIITNKKIFLKNDTIIAEG